MADLNRIKTIRGLYQSAMQRVECVNVDISRSVDQLAQDIGDSIGIWTMGRYRKGAQLDIVGVEGLSGEKDAGRALIGVAKYLKNVPGVEGMVATVTKLSSVKGVIGFSPINGPGESGVILDNPCIQTNYGAAYTITA